MEKREKDKQITRENRSERESESKREKERN
jgi:hypothetical protein